MLVLQADVQIYDSDAMQHSLARTYHNNPLKDNRGANRQQH
jgi:hypothetical protein